MANANPATTLSTAPAVTTTTEAVKNCAGCNKPMRKAKRYYRNGKYYCNKKCWKTASTTPAKKE